MVAVVFVFVLFILHLAHNYITLILILQMNILLERMGAHLMLCPLLKLLLNKKNS